MTEVTKVTVTDMYKTTSNPSPDVANIKNILKSQIFTTKSLYYTRCYSFTYKTSPLPASLHLYICGRLLKLPFFFIMFVAPFSQHHASSNQLSKSLQQVKVYQWTDIHHPHQPEKYKQHLYISWHFIHAYNQDVTTRYHSWNDKTPHNLSNWDSHITRQLSYKHSFCQNVVSTKKLLVFIFFIKT